MAHLALGAIGVAGGTAILLGLSATELRQGIAALAVALSPAEVLTLNSAAPGTPASRDIIDRFGANIADQIAGVVRDTFVSGLHQAYWLPLVMAVIGIFVALALDEEKLTQVTA